MSKLTPKSATVPRGPELVSVRTMNDVNFWGISGKQLSVTMVGLHMTWDGTSVRMTHDSKPGEEKLLLASGIEHLTFKVGE